MEEIISAIKILKNRYTAGVDSISDIIIKKCVNYLIKPLTHLCNALLETGVFPEKFKMSKVIPLYLIFLKSLRKLCIDD